MNLKEQIEAARGEVQAADDRVHVLMRQCPHEFKLLTDEMKHELRECSYEYGSAICQICDNNFGWRCADSPDTVCHYYTNDGNHVKLIDGTLANVPSGHDHRYETSDCCIFCGNPDERK